MAFSSTIDLGSGRYPIVLSDALLGKSTREIYTGIRYDQKPSEYAHSPSVSHILKPNEEDPARFNLSITDESEKLAYHGRRTVNEAQYILIFDPSKESFVLHRLDSTFDMLLDNPQSDYAGSTPGSPPAGQQEEFMRNSNQGEGKDKPIKSTKFTREPTPDEEESDDDLIVEYPGVNDQKFVKGSAITTYQRQIRESSEQDEEISDEDDDSDRNVENIRLPSPTSNPKAEISDEEMEMALEAELEQELMRDSAEHTVPESESDESEEE